MNGANKAHFSTMAAHRASGCRSSPDESRRRRGGTNMPLATFLLHHACRKHERTHSSRRGEVCFASRATGGEKDGAQGISQDRRWCGRRCRGIRCNRASRTADAAVSERGSETAAESRATRRDVDRRGRPPATARSALGAWPSSWLGPRPAPGLAPPSLGSAPLAPPSLVNMRALRTMRSNGWSRE